MSQASDRPTADRIAAELVRRINAGELQSGDRIVEQALADEFQTSRGPVRDALQILNARNWIDLMPRQGARVAQRGAAPTLETVLIGGAMLGLAYRLAVIKGSDQDLDVLFSRVQSVIRHGRARPTDPAAFSAAALEAGNLAISLADNRRIDDIVGPVPQGALSSYIPAGVQSEAALDEAVDLWIELATAFRMRDQIAAERLGRTMAEQAYRRILEGQLTELDPQGAA